MPAPRIMRNSSIAQQMRSVQGSFDVLAKKPKTCQPRPTYDNITMHLWQEAALISCFGGALNPE